MSKIKAYKLLEPEELSRIEGVLPKLLFDLPQDSENFDFFISPISGWMYYSNFEEIRRNDNPNLLPLTHSEIKRIAYSFFDKAKKKLDQYRKRDKNLKQFDLFPRSLNKPNIYPYLNDETGLIDHWIVKFQPLLASGIKDLSNIPVIGSSITLRIGKYGKVIALTSNWRPIIASNYLILSEFIEDTEKKDGNNHTHHHEGENDHEDTGEIRNKVTEQMLCYWESGGDTFINYYLPMYYSIEGHHFGFQPACPQAMVTKIVEDHHSDLVDLYISVNGGSGRYTVNWATWDIVDYRDTYKEYNDLFTIQLSEGAYHVRVTVVDKLTGIVSQVQNMVFVHTQNKNNTLV